MKNYFYYEFPIGTLGIMENEMGICKIFLRTQNSNRIEGKERRTELLDKAASQLQEYFAGKRKGFDLPLSIEGTEFQKKVWNALLTIPYGETRSYSSIAVQIGNSKACRAVGMANNKNPLMILVPCHRVVGKNGNLIGYAGGLDMKNQLLELEKKFIFS